MDAVGLARMAAILGVRAGGPWHASKGTARRWGSIFGAQPVKASGKGERGSVADVGRLQARPLRCFVAMPRQRPTRLGAEQRAAASQGGERGIGGAGRRAPAVSGWERRWGATGPVWAAEGVRVQAQMAIARWTKGRRLGLG